MTLYGLSFTLALLLSLCLTPPVRAVARWAKVLDVPDGRRKLHPTSVPLLGGIAVFVSFYVCLWLVATQMESPSAQSGFELASATFAPSLLVLALGIADDKWSVSPWAKIGVQIVAGLIVYYQVGIRIDSLSTFFSHSPMAGALSLAATLFWILLITNAFNVVDGMDGLATGVAFIALACMFVVSIQMNQPPIAMVAAPLAGAVLGFLRYNFNPASIFLGDSGSLFLGFQLAVLSIVGSQKSSTAVAVAAPIFVLALPLVEAATSAARRFLSGRSIMQPDSAHIHHQLIRLGCTPRRAAGILYLSSGAFGLTSLLVVHSGSPQIGLIAVSFFALTVLAIQRLGYSEFAEINGALKRFVHQRRIIQNGIVCRKLASDLVSAASIGDVWSAVKDAARQLGFSYVELKLRSKSVDADAAGIPRYAQRFVPQPGSGQPVETTFAVALSGKKVSGRVVFSRSATAAPLHSELPLLINAVSEILPRVIERTLPLSVIHGPVSDEPPKAQPALARVETTDKTVSPSLACGSCGSSRLFRSRSRSTLEQLHKKLTSRRLFECGVCGWRGWRTPMAGAVAEISVVRRIEHIDLHSLDRALQNVRTPHQH